MDQTKNCSGHEEDAKAAKANPRGSDLCNSRFRRQTENQAGKKWGLSGLEWLGLIILALAIFWTWRSPPTNPTDWLHWLFGSGYVISPARALLALSVYISFLVIKNYRRLVHRDFFPGSVVVKGVSILEFNPDSSARRAGMNKGDVIIEYASERDVTLEKLSAVMAKRGPEAGQVCVAFVRDGQQYSQTLPSGPLGISAMDTKVNVLLKSE